MKLINKILANIFYSTAGSVISTFILASLLPTANIINQTTDKQKDNNMNMFLNPSFIASVLISIFLVIMFLFCRKLFLQTQILKDQIKIFSIVSHIRSKRLFVKSFDLSETYTMPNETNEEVWKGLPEGGLFMKHFMEEYNIVDSIVRNKMKHKTINEIDELLRFYYPIKK